MSADPADLRERRWIARDLITLGWDWLAEVNRLYAESGLTWPDEMVLGTLVLDHGGRCRPSKLDAPVKMAGSTLTHAMRRLERGGYVVRETDPNDRRALWLVATSKGERWIHDTMPILDALVDEWFEPITDKNEAELRRILARLRRET